MSFISSVPITAELPLWSQNLIGFGFLAILLFFIFGVMLMLEREARRKFILRDFSSIMAMSGKEFSVFDAVRLYDMSVWNLMDTWVCLTKLIDKHNRKLGIDATEYSVFYLSVLICECHSKVAIVRKFERFFVNRWLRKMKFTKPKEVQE